MDGKKYDEGKPRMDLIPPELLTEVAKILTFGANKYADRNWEKGMDWGRVYGALQRHLWSWWSGDSKDAETNESHLAHAACCIAFLIAYEQRGVGKDTRMVVNVKEDNGDTPLLIPGGWPSSARIPFRDESRERVSD